MVSERASMLLYTYIAILVMGPDILTSRLGSPNWVLLYKRLRFKRVHISHFHMHPIIRLRNTICEIPGCRTVVEDKRLQENDSL
jgi:hypothetical protein